MFRPAFLAIPLAVAVCATAGVAFADDGAATPGRSASAAAPPAGELQIVLRPASFHLADLPPKRYDLMLDVAGSRSWSECRRVLAPRATLVIVGGPKTNRLLGPLSHVVKMRMASLGSRRKVSFFIAKLTRADMEVLRGLLEAGDVTPVVDRRYELSDATDAFRYLGEGHAQGKIVVTV